MTSDEARDQFSPAHDGELSDEERRAFDATLAADAALSAEFKRFVAMMHATRQVAARHSPAPNLLPKVQARIRKRSRGRFYRDRYSERSGLHTMLPLLAGGVMLLLLGALWLMAQHL